MKKKIYYTLKAIQILLIYRIVYQQILHNCIHRIVEIVIVKCQIKSSSR